MARCVPRLPPKQLDLRSGPPDPNRVAERMMGLDLYLRAIMSIERVARSSQMLTFLGAYMGMDRAWAGPPDWSCRLRWRDR